MKRDANIELLRIVSMILIIAGHLVEQNNVIEKINGISLFTALLLGSAYRIAVNIFLLIGVWFMVNKEFSARRITFPHGFMAFHLKPHKKEETTWKSYSFLYYHFSQNACLSFLFYPGWFPLGMRGSGSCIPGECDVESLM